MLLFNVRLRDAEKAKTRLKAAKLYDYNYNAERDAKSIGFPILKREETLLSEFKESKFKKSNQKIVIKKEDYKDYLAGKLQKSEIDELPVSYDIIGDILILDLKNNKHEKQIGEALLKANKNIKTILKKSGIHEGEFRTQKLKYIAGENKKETVYKENNVLIKLNVEEVYFSERLSSERKRICSYVKKGEKILVMFSGCAPYPLVLSKNTEAESVTGIEKNPAAHKYATINVKLNKAKNITLIEGDVRDKIHELKRKFDRILMPLPKEAEDFLYLAFSASKKGAIIHFYDFEHESELANGEKKVLEAAKKHRKNIEILRTVKCGQYSPGKFRICVDFTVK